MDQVELIDERGPLKFSSMLIGPIGVCNVSVFTPNTWVALNDTSGVPSESAARACCSLRFTPASPALRASETERSAIRASSYESCLPKASPPPAMPPISTNRVRERRSIGRVRRSVMEVGPLLLRENPFDQRLEVGVGDAVGRHRNCAPHTAAAVFHLQFQLC